MNKPLTPFTFLDTITRSGGKDILTDETENQYVPFIINRQLSYFVDTVLFANEMNMQHYLSKRAQYQYYLSSIPKRNRFAKWERKVKDDDVDLISKAFQCNKQRAQEFKTLLTADQLEQLRTQYARNESGTVVKPVRGSKAKASGRLPKSKGNATKNRGSVNKE